MEPTVGHFGDADAALFDRMEATLYAAVVSDVLDAMGYRHQAMRLGIRPLLADSTRMLVGRAAPMLVVPQAEVVAQPYTQQIAAIDALESGDVAVVGVGGLAGVAVWGELFSHAALARGARGMVTDGCHRDGRMIRDLGFPVYSAGARPVDISGRGTVAHWGQPVEVGGVVVRRGDIIVAEIDGIVVVPADVAAEVAERAFAKVATEDRARDDLRQGAYLAEVWQRYRVL